MNNRIIYHPLTATPLKRNIAYTELTPCKELHSYIRCYWGTENPLIQIENNDSPKLVIPDTCVDIIYHIDYTDNVVTGGFCEMIAVSKQIAAELSGTWYRHLLFVFMRGVHMHLPMILYNQP